MAREAPDEVLVEAVAAAADGDDRRLEREAIKLIGRRELVGALDTLVKISNTPDREIAQWGLDALSKLHGDEVARAYEEFPALPTRIARAPSDEVARAYEEFLNHADHGVYGKAIWGIGQTGQPSQRVESRLMPFLESEHEGVEMAAIKALGRVGTVAAVSKLNERTTGFFRDGDLKDVARAAIDLIMARTDAEAGSLSLTQSVEDGKLSVAPDTEAALSFEEGEEVS